MKIPAIERNLLIAVFFIFTIIIVGVACAIKRNADAPKDESNIKHIAKLQVETKCQCQPPKK